MRSDIVPGAIFPDYELSDHTAKHRRLSELQGQHPMVLVLSRGGYCPKDRRQAEGLLELHREMEVGYCRLVTISTDNITETNEYRSGVGAHWPFLSDTRRIVQKDLDIAEYTDPAHNPMIPHVFVLEPGLVIYKIYNGYWFFGRPTMEDLRQDLRAVTKKCRPDWDITAPNSRRRGSKAARNFSIPTAKPTPKLSVNRTKSGVGVSKAANPLRSLVETGQNVQVGTPTGFLSMRCAERTTANYVLIPRPRFIWPNLLRG
jgi:peroxiredoxin